MYRQAQLAIIYAPSKLLELVEPHCAQIKKARKFKDEPCWEAIHKEMSHKHMTIQLVYEEYITQHGVLRSAPEKVPKFLRYPRDLN